jgi:hypothetical protein
MKQEKKEEIRKERERNSDVTYRISEYSPVIYWVQRGQ